MAKEWVRKRVLIVVRTYPVPAHKGTEVSCTAGVTEDRQWIRLFPVPYRFLQQDQRFTKYQWVEVEIRKATGDTRPESFNLNIDTLHPLETVSTERGWRKRKEILGELVRPSMCAIRDERDRDGHPTLGLFKPHTITRLIIEPDATGWSAEQLATLQQQDLFGHAPKEQLEKLPYIFKYEYRCSDEGCKGHNMTCFDWEMGQAYRRWREQYGEQWEEKFRQRFEREMIEKNDTHFFVGTMHQHPGTWIIIGLFYPPKLLQQDLFGT